MHAGVLTTDPRIVSDARPVPLLTYEEASELAFFGATVLHPSAMQPALQTSNLDVRVKNSYNRFSSHQPSSKHAGPLYRTKDAGIGSNLTARHDISL